MKKKIFITGDQGYIAKEIKKQLLTNGYDITNDSVEVSHICCTFSLENKCLFQAFKGRDPEINIENYTALRSAIEVDVPDIIIHTASFVGSDICDMRAIDAINSNVLGTHNVIKICQEFGIKLVFFSTTVIYDSEDYSKKRFKYFSQSEFNEKSPINPQTLYGITKFDAELQVINILGIENAIIVRPVFVYGDYPNDLSSAITKILYNGYANREKNRNNSIEIRLHPKYYKDYMRVEDCASAVIHLINNNLWGEDFNISRGGNRTFQNYFDYVQKTYPGNYNIKFLCNSDYLKNHLCNNSKILSTGWSPEIGFDSGIDLTYISIVNNIDIEPYWYISNERNKK